MQKSKTKFITKAYSLKLEHPEPGVFGHGLKNKVWRARAKVQEISLSRPIRNYLSTGLIPHAGDELTMLSKIKHGIEKRTKDFDFKKTEYICQNEISSLEFPFYCPDNFINDMYWDELTNLVISSSLTVDEFVQESLRLIEPKSSNDFKELLQDIAYMRVSSKNFSDIRRIIKPYINKPLRSTRALDEWIVEKFTELNNNKKDFINITDFIPLDNGEISSLCQNYLKNESKGHYQTFHEEHLKLILAPGAVLKDNTTNTMFLEDLQNLHCRFVYSGQNEYEELTGPFFVIEPQKCKTRCNINLTISVNDNNKTENAYVDSEVFWKLCNNLEQNLKEYGCKGKYSVSYGTIYDVDITAIDDILNALANIINDLHINSGSGADKIITEYAFMATTRPFKFNDSKKSLRKQLTKAIQPEYYTPVKVVFESSNYAPTNGDLREIDKKINQIDKGLFSKEQTELIEKSLGSMNKSEMLAILGEKLSIVYELLQEDLVSYTKVMFGIGNEADFSMIIVDQDNYHYNNNRQRSYSLLNAKPTGHSSQIIELTANHRSIKSWLSLVTTEAFSIEQAFKLVANMCELTVSTTDPCFRVHKHNADKISKAKHISKATLYKFFSECPHVGTCFLDIALYSMIVDNCYIDFNKRNLSTLKASAIITKHLTYSSQTSYTLYKAPYAQRIHN